MPEASASPVGRGKSGSPLGELQTPLTCIWNQPTHRGLGKRSVHTQIFGNDFHTGNNSEAGSQSNTGKGSSVQFTLLWKGFLGYLARPKLPESLKGHSWKEGPWDTSSLLCHKPRGITGHHFYVSDDQLPTEEPRSQQTQGKFWHHYPSSEFQTPAGSAAGRTNAHGW